MLSRQPSPLDDYESVLDLPDHLLIWAMVWGPPAESALLEEQDGDRAPIFADQSVEIRWHVNNLINPDDRASAVSIRYVRTRTSSDPKQFMCDMQKLLGVAYGMAN